MIQYRSLAKTERLVSSPRKVLQLKNVTCDVFFFTLAIEIALLLYEVFLWHWKLLCRHVTIVSNLKKFKVGKTKLRFKVFLERLVE